MTLTLGWLTKIHKHCSTLVLLVCFSQRKWKVKLGALQCGMLCCLLASVVVIHFSIHENIKVVV